jgi:ribosome-binding protein aMBF1 (putative translation factor)
VSVLNHKVLLAAGVGTLTAVLFGGAALATFAPIAYDSPSQIDVEVGTAAPANSGNDKLKSILDGLVGKGLITQAQEDAILAAVQAAAPKRDAATVRNIFASLFDESAKYLNVTPADLKTKLAGTNLGALAEKTTGKSQSGLVNTLQAVVNAAIDKALAETKITTDQATKAKADAPAQIAKFVQQNYPQPRAPKTNTRVLSVTEFIGDIYSAARDYLGLSQADLLKALREGKTLGEIAPTIAGKNKVDLVAKITATANAKIDKALTDGKLTADQATAVKAQVGPAVTALVDRKLPTAIGRPPTLDRKP